MKEWLRKYYAFTVMKGAKMKEWLGRYYIFIVVAGIFFAVAWKFQPEDSGGVGKTILIVLGILAFAGILVSGIYLYSKYGRKISLSSLDDAGKLFGRLMGRDKIGTTLLVSLFLLTLSYAIGGREEWADSARWWWNSKIFLPSLLAVVGVILFVDPKWRKRFNNTLIFTTGAMIIFSLLMVTPAMISWRGETVDDRGKTAKKVVVPRAPQNVTARAVAVKSTKTKTVFAEYGAFTEVPLPPTEKLVSVNWSVPPEYATRCLVAVEEEGRTETRVLPCGQEKWFSRATRVGFSSDDPLEGIPVTVKISYLEAE